LRRLQADQPNVVRICLGGQDIVSNWSNKKFELRRSLLGTSLALIVGLALMLPWPATRAEALPVGLPTHFAFGLHAAPGDAWLAQSAVPWDYTYQYLVGGVNTNAGWETWNTSGQFPLYYAQSAAASGRIPMFPYYELLQSNGTCNTCAENQRDIVNLNNAGLMQAYYANFALLMKRLGPGTYDGIKGFGKTALINLEPDFTVGYAMQAVNNNAECFGYCTGQGNNPGFLKASVASSGYADVAGYADDYSGFTRAIAHLRDLYAPNVLLGPNISNFATGTDIGTDTNPNTNAAALGQQVGVFLSQTGAHDVLFNDPLDRDAGQYKAWYGQNRWWDRLNVTFPNFQRWEQYLQAIRSADGDRSILLWQVPIGNQYFATVNNTNGHFQDNRAEYIFDHVPELIQSGIVGVMFGAGNSGNSVQTDAAGDGITNPAPICTSDGLSSGQICNNHTSTVTDDDGGYIRMRGQSYYQSPIMLSSSSTAPNPTASPTRVAGYSSSATTSSASPAAGATLVISASVTSAAAATNLIDLEIYDGAGTKVHQQGWDNQAFSAGQTRTYSSSWQIPATAPAGNYTVAIGVFQPNWASLTSWNGSAANFSIPTSANNTATSTPTLSPTSTPTAKPTNTPTPTATATATATRTATPKPTNTPLPTATSVAAPQPGYTTSASAAPVAVARGAVVSFSASARSNAAASNMVVDLEVYDSSGVKVFQTSWTGQSFSAAQSRTYITSWSVPSTARVGQYTVKIGIFGPNWTPMVHWNNGATTFTIQ
jgi:hypothetical protein